MATRIIRAYRTVSHDVAVTIAGITPLSIQAKIEADIFKKIRTAKANGESVTKADKMQKRRNALQSARRAWIRGLGNGGTARLATLGAIAPVIQPAKTKAERHVRPRHLTECDNTRFDDRKERGNSRQE